MSRLRTEQRGQQAPSAPSNQEPFRFEARLVAGLDDDALAEFASRWRNSAAVRKAVVEVLTKDLDRAILLSESPDSLNSPNPLAVLSDLHGYRRGLRAAIKLLTN